ncbi:O-fucosyltransferase 16 [Linum perenne]
MAGHRRRHLSFYNRLRSLLPLISAISGFLLIFFAVLSFLAPSPNVSGNMYQRLDVFVDDGDARVADTRPVFRVPDRGGVLDRDIWGSINSTFFYGCSDASNTFRNADSVTKPDRFLLIATSGGLNQQRTGITDSVVAARILNATLVVPKLDEKSFWKDSSNFSEIFDVDWFISSLKNDVKIIKELPRKRGKTWTPHNMRIARKCSEKCYQTRVLPALLKRHAIQLGKFDYRLANKLDTQLQKLRCRANYHALRFTDPIHKMGDILVERMRMRSKNYIALHLRFEPDMLAFSGCDYGGGEKEIKELSVIRKRWKTLHTKNPEKERRHGKCPLTPHEVGLMLRALGYGRDVHIYVASGEVYRGEDSLAPLKKLFPNYYTKETLARHGELQPFTSFSSRMAALDFIVCDESDVFVTNNNGNMAKILAGRRRYFGHKPTIRPNAKKLYRLFLNQNNMTWEAFASKVRTFQKGFMGEPNEVRPGRGEFHENPHTCVCEDSEAEERKDPPPRKVRKSYNTTTGGDSDNSNTEIEPELSDPDNDDDQDVIDETGSFNTTAFDYDGFNSKDHEFEDVLSD